MRKDLPIAGIKSVVHLFVVESVEVGENIEKKFIWKLKNQA
jgi:hypothetical protein